MHIFYKLYFAFITIAVIAFAWLITPHTSSHFLALNSTVINDTTCRYTWLGGVDYDSFVGDVTVDNVSVGHPEPMTRIHEGRCDAVVRIYMKDVKTYVQLYPKAYGI